MGVTFRAWSFSHRSNIPAAHITHKVNCKKIHILIFSTYPHIPSSISPYFYTSKVTILRKITTIPYYFQ